MNRFLAWLTNRPCKHEFEKVIWEGAPAWYTDPQYGFTVSLQTCVKCGAPVVVQI